MTCHQCGSANVVPTGGPSAPAQHCRTCGCTTTTAVLAVLTHDMPAALLEGASHG